MEITSHPPRLDALTLVQDHGWRLAVHLGVLSFALQKSATAASGEEILPCTGLLFGFYLVLTSLSLYWIYSEFALIRRRSSLPPGPLGWPMVGTFLSVFSKPVETSLALRKRFGSTLYTNNFFGRLVVTLGDDESLEWIWHQERKGETVQQWPPTIQQLLGAGSVGNLNGHRHRVLRRILDGALAPGAVPTRQATTTMAATHWRCISILLADSTAAEAAGRCGPHGGTRHGGAISSKPKSGRACKSGAGVRHGRVTETVEPAKVGTCSRLPASCWRC